MKGVDRPLTQLIKAMSQFVIPVFQRDYSWRANEHCEQLWNDVLRVANSETQKSHFLGAIVGMPDEDHAIGFNRCQVVDGQQRLTTATLLLVALRDHLRDAPDESVELTADQIDSTYLRDPSRKGEQRYRLLLRRHDRNSLCALIDGQPTEAPSVNIEAAYRFFRDRIKTVDPESVWRGIHQLVVVEVTLNDETDNPQEIFESLNTTGLTLSKSDLIRNYILMGLQPERQTHLYEYYWRRIEDCFRGLSEHVFDDFARDYADVKTKRSTQTRRHRIYAAFKEFWRRVTVESSVETALDDMLKHARYYADFHLGREEQDERRARYRRIRYISAVPANAVMRLRACRDEVGEFAEKSFLEALDLIESFLVRGAICGWTDKAYNKIFVPLASGIGESTPFDDFKGGLGLNLEGYAFPDDAVFLRALRESDMYRRRRLCKFVLDRLEHHRNKHRTDTSQYTIEHILPQNARLSDDWINALGNEWREIQETWVHRLGNLTLTAYNPEYSDRAFHDKKTMERGFEESALRINRFVNKQNQWTAAEIEARTEELAREAVAIWPPLDADHLVDRARLRDRQRQAAGRTVDRIQMVPAMRELFGTLQHQVVACGTDIVEVPESKSISYWRPRYFLEVVPQKHRLHLLLALGLDEIENPPEGVGDLREWAFVAGSRYRRESRSIYSVTDNRDTMDAALHLIRQAYDAAG